MKIKKYLTLMAFALVFGVFTQSCNEAQPKEITFENPLVFQRADPWVHKAEDGTYYLIATAPEYDRIEISSASTINGLKDAEAKVIWRKHNEGPMGNHIWAPELHRFDGKWHIYFAAGTAEERWKIRMHVLSNTSAFHGVGGGVRQYVHPDFPTFFSGAGCKIDVPLSVEMMQFRCPNMVAHGPCIMLTPNHFGVGIFKTING